MDASLSTAASSPELPMTVEGYRPLLELGRGGMTRLSLAQRTTRGLRKRVVVETERSLETGRRA